MSHAKLAPSGAERWMTCTAAPGFIEELTGNGTVPKETDSVWSREGTEAHDWASKVLLGQTKISSVPEKFRPHVKEYVALCRAVQVEAGKDAKRMVERKVPLFYSPEETGTVDFGILSDRGLWINDLKYGSGVEVHAEDNMQLAIYATSVIINHERFFGKLPHRFPVSMSIFQPRYRGDEPLKTWNLTAGELKEIIHDPVIAKAKEIQSAKHYNELEFQPTEKGCRFCPVKAVCAARATHLLQDLPGTRNGVELFTDLDDVKPATIPLETLVRLYRYRKEAKKFFEQIELYLLTMVSTGKSVPGTKLVLGREGNRKWSSEEEARQWLDEQGLEAEEYEKNSIVGPATIDTLLKNQLKDTDLLKEFKALITRSAAKVTLTMEDDKRPAVTTGAELLVELEDGE